MAATIILDELMMLKVILNLTTLIIVTFNFYKFINRKHAMCTNEHR